MQIGFYFMFLLIDGELIITLHALINLLVKLSGNVEAITSGNVLELMNQSENHNWISNQQKNLWKKLKIRF